MTDTNHDLYWRKAGEYFSNQRLELTIMPTERCNFRCTYCYEDFAVGKMSRATIDALKKHLYARLPELQLLQIRWFGGEPLLATDIMEEISEYVEKHAPRDHAFRHEGTVTTNGWHLTLEKAARLSSLGVRAYQVTLDGPQAFHDQTRVGADGRATYDVIHRNLRALRDSELDISVELRLHLTPANLPKIDDFARFLGSEYLRDSRFTLEPFPVGHLGGANDDGFAVVSMMDAIGAMKRIRELARADRPALEAAAVAGEPPRDRYVCYAARGNAYVIRADGAVGKCTVALNDTRNRLGTLLENGELQIEAAKAGLWMGGWAESNWSALQCPLDALQEAEPWKNVRVIRKGMKP